MSGLAVRILGGLGPDMKVEVGQQTGQVPTGYIALVTEVPTSVAEAPSKECTGFGSRNYLSRPVVAYPTGLFSYCSPCCLQKQNLCETCQLHRHFLE